MIGCQIVTTDGDRALEHRGFRAAAAKCTGGVRVGGSRCPTDREHAMDRPQRPVEGDRVATIAQWPPGEGFWADGYAAV